jgi:hypothetical protein
MSVLTDADRQILPLATRAQGGFHVACKWYMNGWEPMWYQYLFHQTTDPYRLVIPNVTFLAGIATGKTTAVASSYLMDCLTIPYFRALNTSVTAKQAELPFAMVQGWIEGNPRLEHLVDNIALRPWPLITFKNGSEWIFRTAGKDARFIRGMEFDRLNFDEAGLDPVGETIKVLRGRLRGTRTDGSLRMARMDVTTSPTAAPWLEERFYRGWPANPQADLANFLSLRVETYMNTKLTQQMIALMEAEYSDDMIDVELRALFPEFGLSMFPRGHVAACTDQSLNDAAELALHPENGKVKRGYVIEEHPRYGITKFELPADPGAIYIMGGDPGTDSPPKRNAGVVGVLDISKKPNQLVYFDWVDGRGSYNPFLFSYKYALDKYRPVLRGLDTTGTQKAIDELAFENVGIQVDGLSFNRDKEGMLNSLSVAVTNHSMVWPVIRGIQRQMTSYARETDKQIPQDIVMMLAELAFLERHAPEIEASTSSAGGSAGHHYPRGRRTNTARRRQ